MKEDVVAANLAICVKVSMNERNALTGKMSLQANWSNI